ncbi:MAG: LptF/LptG family permease [Phycisphaerales bacterium]|nr:LptF/LptG family permease [Phycisphaerales bacterium]
MEDGPPLGQGAALVMGILTRSILLRFLGNFFLLFGLLFVFAISIDVLIQWDKFVAAATAVERAGKSPAGSASILGVAKAILNFHGPRVFQFYQYMMPLVALGAMGFTASAMHRNREFVAILSAGISMRRAVAPMILGMGLLALLQAANQELLLPRLAPRLLLEHGDMVRGVAPTWGIEMVADSEGRLIHAASFDPSTQVLTRLYVVERTPEGGVVRRIEAASAKWSPEKRVWNLVNGKMGVPAGPTDAPTGSRGRVFLDQPIDSFATDLDPETLSLRRHRLYAHLLSLAEIAELSRNSAVDAGSLRRFAVGRFAALVVGILVLVISIPFFALREPTPILRQAVLCSAVSLPILLIAMVVMTVPLPSVAPTVGVVLPVVLLIPFAAWRIAAIKT